MDESEELVDRAVELVSDALSSSVKQPLEESYINARVRESLGSFLYKETGRRPMIVPLPIEV